MTLRKLIDESDVACMTLYRRFAGKEGLIKEVLEQRQSFVVGSIVEKLGPMPNAATRLKGIFDQYGTWLRTPEFVDCLFERALTELGGTWPGMIDVAVRYRDDLLVMMEMLLKDVVPTNTARRLAGVYVMQLAGAMADVRAIGDPSVASQAWHAAETLLYQARTTTEAA